MKDFKRKQRIYQSLLTTFMHKMKGKKRIERNKKFSATGVCIYKLVTHSQWPALDQLQEHSGWYTGRKSENTTCFSLFEGFLLLLTFWVSSKPQKQLSKTVVPFYPSEREIENAVNGKNVYELLEQCFPNDKMPTNALESHQNAVSGLVGLNWGLRSCLSNKFLAILILLQFGHFDQHSVRA